MIRFQTSILVIVVSWLAAAGCSSDERDGEPVGFTFLVEVVSYDPVDDEGILTAADLMVTYAGETVFQGTLTAATNTVTLPDDMGVYQLSVFTDGHVSFAEVYTAEQLMVYSSSALVVTLAREPPPPAITFTRTFGGPEIDDARAVKLTDDGGYVIAGETTSFGAGTYDFWLFKTDAEGNEVWNKTFGGTGRDKARSVHVTADGGYIIGGYTTAPSAGGYDLWLVRADANGDKVWDTIFGGMEADIGWSATPAIDGGFVIAGYTLSFGAGMYDFWLIKTDMNGDEEWRRTYGGAGLDNGYSVESTADGGFVLAGSTRDGDDDFWVVRTDSAGEPLWTQAYGGPGYDIAKSVYPTDDGGFVLAGHTTSFGAVGMDVWLLRIDGDGNEVWAHSFGGAGDDLAHAVQPTDDGGYIVAGYTDSFGAGGADFWLIKTDADGVEQWNRTFGGAADDIAYAVQPTPDGGYVTTGYTSSFGAGDFDFWLIKTDADGNVDAL